MPAGAETADSDDISSQQFAILAGRDAEPSRSQMFHFDLPVGMIAERYPGAGGQCRRIHIARILCKIRVPLAGKPRLEGRPIVLAQIPGQDVERGLARLHFGPDNPEEPFQGIDRHTFPRLVENILRQRIKVARITQRLPENLLERLADGGRENHSAKIVKNVGLANEPLL